MYRQCAHNARNAPRATASSRGVPLAPRASRGVPLAPRASRGVPLAPRASRGIPLAACRQAEGRPPPRGCRVRHCVRRENVARSAPRGVFGRSRTARSASRGMESHGTLITPWRYRTKCSSQHVCRAQCFSRHAQRAERPPRHAQRADAEACGARTPLWKHVPDSGSARETVQKRSGFAAFIVVFALLCYDDENETYGNRDGRCGHDARSAQG